MIRRTLMLQNRKCRAGASYQRRNSLDRGATAIQWRKEWALYGARNIYLQWRDVEYTQSGSRRKARYGIPWTKEEGMRGCCGPKRKVRGDALDRGGRHGAWG